MELRTRAQSSTARQMGPSLSMVHESAMAPVRGTKPNVGRNPVAPQRVDGDEMDPRVSDPMAKATHPAAVADEEPADDPQSVVHATGFQRIISGTLLREPRIAGHAAKPFVTHGKRAEREFGHENGAGFIQTLNHRGVFFEFLFFKSTCAPRGAIAFYGKKVLGSPWQTMERATIFPGGNLTVSLFRLCFSPVFRQCDNEMQPGIVTL